MSGCICFLKIFQNEEQTAWIRIQYIHAYIGTCDVSLFTSAIHYCTVSYDSLPLTADATRRH